MTVSIGLAAEERRDVQMVLLGPRLLRCGAAVDVEAGRLARGAGRIPQRRWAVPSSPMDGRMADATGSRGRA